MALIDDENAIAYVDSEGISKPVLGYAGKLNVNAYLNQDQIDASKRTRVSLPLIYGDFKTVSDKNLLLWDYSETGSSTHILTGSCIELSVTSGQYSVAQTTYYAPYMSSRSQIIDTSFARFEPQSGVIKKVGYFTSSTGSPFNSSVDGFYLQSASGVVSLEIYRNGISILSVPQSQWLDPLDGTGESGVTINWSNFNVAQFDFLWLGGTTLRFSMFLEGDLVELYNYNHSNNDETVFIKSPCKPIRYDIHSTNGSGVFRKHCASFGNEGGEVHVGISRGAYVPVSGVSCDNSDVVYPLIMIRLKPNSFASSVKLTNLSTLVGSNNKYYVHLILNPTFSSSPTWHDFENSEVQWAVNGNGMTCTGGTFIYNKTAISGISENQVLSETIRLGQKINGTKDVFALCIRPITSNITAFGTMDFVEFL